MTDVVVCRTAPRPALLRWHAALRNWLQTGNWNPATVGPVFEFPPALRNRLVECADEELVVRAQWCGYAVREEPLTHPAKKRQAALKLAWLHLRLVVANFCLPTTALRICSERAYARLPRKQRWRRLFREVMRDETQSDARVAGSVGLGCFMGIAPIWGFQLPAAVLTAHATGLSKPIAAISTQISLPVLMPAIFATSLVLGRLLLGDKSAVWDQSLTRTDLGAWAIGSVALGAAVGMIGATVTYVLLRMRKT